jgi:hypothetical protein
MFPLRISRGTINSSVEIAPLNSLNIQHRAMFEIVAAVVRSDERECFVFWKSNSCLFMVVMFGVCV